MKIEIFKNLKNRKFRFSLNFLWKISPIFRSQNFRKISDLKIFDLRFLQEKLIFNFRVFSRSKVWSKCLIINRLEHSRAKTNRFNFTSITVWHLTQGIVLKWVEFREITLYISLPEIGEYTKRKCLVLFCLTQKNMFFESQKTKHVVFPWSMIQKLGSEGPNRVRWKQMSTNSCYRSKISSSEE